MTTHNVSTSAALKSALANAQAGDRIELAAGDYGDLRLAHLDFAAPVEIAAADGSRPPVFRSIALWNCDNLSFDGVDIDFTPRADTVEWDAAFRADNSTDVSLRNSTISGGPSVAGIDPDSVPGSQGPKGILGLPIGNGMAFNNCRGITVETSEISDFKAGIRASDTDGLTVRGVEIHDIRTVPVGGGNVNDVLIEGSHFHTIRPWAYGGRGDHGDFVHFWTRPDTGPNRDFVLRDNFFSQDDGVAVLGIYLDDNRNDAGFRDVTIEGNVLHSANAQGMRLEDVVGGVIRQNTLLQTRGDASDAPKIYIAGGTRDLTIADNILPGIVTRDGVDLAANGIAREGNVHVQIQSPLGDGYAPDLLRDPLADAPEYHDLLAVPGGPAEGAGPGGGRGAAILTDERTGIEIGTLDFRVTGAAAVEAVAWDFGSGTTADGLTAEHRFTATGQHRVTAQITYADGTTETVGRTVASHTPVALDIDFDRGAVDDSDIAQTVELLGGAELVASDRGKSVRLDGANATVTVARDDEFALNDAFTLSFAFRAPDDADGWGRALYYSGVAVVDLAEDGLRLRGRTETGDRIDLGTGDLDLSDAAWHQVVYTMDAGTGVATLFLDGQQIDRQDGLSGAQVPTGGHTVHLGNPHGRVFEGLLDDLGYVRDALPPDRVMALHDAFLAGEDIASSLAGAPAGPPSPGPGPAPTPAPSPRTMGPGPAAPGPGPATGPDTVMAVSDAAGLEQALSRAVGGETILLEAGDYGTLKLISRGGRHYEYAEDVTLASADPGRPAVFGGLRLDGARHVAVEDVAVAPGPDAIGVHVTDSADIALRGVAVDGAAGIGGPGTVTGLRVHGSDRVTVEGSAFSALDQGVVITRTDGLSIADNDLHGMTRSGLRLVDIGGAEIAGNHLHDFAPDDRATMIGIGTRRSDIASADIVIRDNLLDLDGQETVRAISLRNNVVDSGRAGTDAFYRNVAIEGNEIAGGGDRGGIAVGETAGLIIDGNTIRPAGDAAPGITISPDARDVIVHDNVLADPAALAQNTGWTVTGNIALQQAGPQASPAGWRDDAPANGATGHHAGTDPDGAPDPEPADASVPWRQTVTPGNPAAFYEAPRSPDVFARDPGDIAHLPHAAPDGLVPLI